MDTLETEDCIVGHEAVTGRSRISLASPLWKIETEVLCFHVAYLSTLKLEDQRSKVTKNMFLAINLQFIHAYKDKMIHCDVIMSLFNINFLSSN